MPSDTETLGFVVMEALASGIPCVGVAAGGLVDIIDSGETGFLAANDNNMIEFSAKVKELVQNEPLRKQFAESAVAWAKDLGWEAATSKLRNIQYRKAIAIHHARDERRRHVPEIVDAIMNAPYQPPR